MENFMQIAINEAKKCNKSGDVPIGAIIVKGNKIIAKAYNKKEKKQCALYHAEILAIEKASKKLKNFRLNECDIYITKEPCLMCVGAILSARIKNIYFGAWDKKYGAIDIAKNNNFNHKCNYIGGILQDECKELLEKFFINLRSRHAT